MLSRSTSCPYRGICPLTAFLDTLAPPRRSGKIQATTVVLCLTILALFASTTAYMVVSFLYYQSSTLQSLILSGIELWSEGDFPLNFPVQRPLKLVTDYSELQPCASTGTLTLNVRLPAPECSLPPLTSLRSA